MPLPTVREERQAMIHYLHAIDALLERQASLTRALSFDAQRHQEGELSLEALAEVALDQLEAYRELEADASALEVPSLALPAHALFTRSFEACAQAHQRLLRSIDQGIAPDMEGFRRPSEFLQAATRQATLAATALGA